MVIISKWIIVFLKQTERYDKKNKLIYQFCLNIILLLRLQTNHKCAAILHLLLKGEGVTRHVSIFVYLITSKIIRRRRCENYEVIKCKHCYYIIKRFVLNYKPWVKIWFQWRFNATNIIHNIRFILRYSCEIAIKILFGYKKLIWLLNLL